MKLENQIAKDLVDKIDCANKYINRDRSKNIARIFAEEMASRLPNINETPPIHRVSEDKYMQFWKFNIPVAINCL